MKTNNNRIILLFLLCIQFNGVIFAQQNTRMGVNLTSNYDTYTIIKPEFGFILEQQVTDHSGFEIGLNYRTYQIEYYLSLNNQAYYPLISEKYLTIPISYKFYSKIINVSLGLSLDYNIGWKYSNASGIFEIRSYKPEYDYYAGLLAKISKEFNLGDNFVLEPELKANLLVVPFERFYGGLGLVFKFDLSKN